MLFMILREADQDETKTASGVPPDDAQIAKVNRLIHEMLGAGVLVAADAFQSTSVDARVEFADGKRSVIEGPFEEVTEKVDAFLLIRVDSKAEAIEWSARFAAAHNSRVQVRELAGMSKFPPLVDLPTMRARMDERMAN